MTAPAQAASTPSERPDRGIEHGEQNGTPERALEEVRMRIEEVDRALVRLIAERVGLARRGGRVKERAGLPTLDPVREAAVIRRAGALAREAGIDDEQVRDIFWRVIGLCRRAQGGSRSSEGAGGPAARPDRAAGSATRM